MKWHTKVVVPAIMVETILLDKEHELKQLDKLCNFYLGSGVHLACPDNDLDSFARKIKALIKHGNIIL